MSVQKECVVPMATAIVADGVANILRIESRPLSRSSMDLACKTGLTLQSLVEV